MRPAGPLKAEAGRWRRASGAAQRRRLDPIRLNSAAQRQAGQISRDRTVQLYEAKHWPLRPEGSMRCLRARMPSTLARQAVRGHAPASARVHPCCHSLSPSASSGTLGSQSRPRRDYQLGNWIVMPPLTSMSQVNRHLRLSLSTRSGPTEPPRSGTQRASSRAPRHGACRHRRGIL